MSAITKLSVPAPKIAGQQLAGNTRIDKALTLSLVEVKGSDGSALTGDVQAGYFLYRIGPAGEELWNDATRTWQTNPGEDALGNTLAATHMSNLGTAGWVATLNPSTLLDASGVPRFTTLPPTQYFIRVLVTAGQPATARGLSGPSNMLSLVRLAGFNPGVPQPAWQGGGANAPIDKPVTLTLAPLSLADGSVPLADEVSKVGVFVQRADGLLWHDKQQVWVTPPSDPEGFAALEPLALTPKADTPPGTPAAYQAELIATGQKDKAGAPRFVALNDGGDAYRLRSFALVKKAGMLHIGLGTASSDLRFVRLQGEERFGPMFDTDGPQDCTDVRFRLRDASGQFSAWLRLRSSPREVELANFDATGSPLASVRLTASGDIELHPATGKKVLVTGDLEAEGIRYQPFGGGAKQTL